MLVVVLACRSRAKSWTSKYVATDPPRGDGGQFWKALEMIKKRYETDMSCSFAGS